MTCRIPTQKGQPVNRLEGSLLPIALVQVTNGGEPLYTSGIAWSKPVFDVVRVDLVVGHVTYATRRTSALHVTGKPLLQ